MNNNIIIGTRDSQLALWQTEWVKSHLQHHLPELQFETEEVKTIGDRILDIPLSDIGDKGLFTKELDVALLQNRIDLAVHSLKDLPTILPDGLTIGAITERWDVRDAFISKHGKNLAELPENTVIATGSLRRKAQLLNYRRDFKMVDIRGNLNTRFRKFDDSNWDGMILAVAGIERLGWADRISEKISMDVMLPAVGQGSFAVVCRENDSRILEIIRNINHRPSEIAATAERAMLRTLEGGCHVPIGAFAQVSGQQLHISGCVASLDGSRLLRTEMDASITNAEHTGFTLAKELLKMGAGEILAEISKNEAQSK
ncbi:MAG: hydroxymethylbilane synthase [Calditrichia bacterium]|nr:hydroxymethylbilane synthase [Calditrichota bacterium]